jgi:parallel beta-helix repeat protein
MIENASDCVLSDLTIQNNLYGIILDDESNDCIIYQCNFINNTIHTVDHANGTVWSQSQNGNYWDSYQGIDNDSNGIGDTPYTIDTDSIDAYPLITPITLEPTVAFTYNPLFPTTQTLVDFSDSSEDIDGNIINNTWKIDGVIFSYEQNPTHQFPDDGSYEIMLTVIDDMQAENSTTRIIEIDNVPPTVSFTFTPEIPLDIQDVECNDDSFDSDGYIINRTWIINESYYYDSDTIHHTFPDDGIYTITLLLTDDDNASSSQTKEIIVKNAGPIAGFSYYSDNGSLLKNTEINFNENAYDADGNIIEYFWDFGDGTTSKEKEPVHIYGNNGVYKISLTVVDDDEATDSYSRNIQIGAKEKSIDLLSGLSLFDILIVAFILFMVVFVIIVSKKYS